jgi:hypothetical protein
VVKALEKGRIQPIYAKVREHGAPVQGARLGGKPGKRWTKGQPNPNMGNSLVAERNRRLQVEALDFAYDRAVAHNRA